MASSVTLAGSTLETTGTSSGWPVAILYRFLAQCVQYPDPSWMTPNFFHELVALIRRLGAMEEAALLEDSCAAPDITDVLQVEYTRLFINGTPHVAAPPYGSVYLDGSLQGPSSARTLTFYREKGYGMAADADLPDHLVHELEFLSCLVEQGDEEGEREFLQRYFRVWFPTFRECVHTHQNHAYYRTVVDLIEFFTKEEA